MCQKREEGGLTKPPLPFCGCCYFLEGSEWIAVRCWRIVEGGWSSLTSPAPEHRDCVWGSQAPPPPLCDR